MRNILALAGLGLLAGAALAAGPAQAMPAAPLASVSPAGDLDGSPSRLALEDSRCTRRRPIESACRCAEALFA